MRVPTTFLALLLLCGLALPAAAEDDAQGVQDAWYALYSGGSKIGWNWERILRTTAEDGSPRWRTETGTYMVLQRGGMELKITESVVTVEDAKGRVVAFEKTSDMGMGPQKTTGRLVGDTMKISVSGREQSVPYPADAIGSVRMRHLLVEAGIAAGTVVEGDLFHADQPSVPLVVKTEVLEEEDVDVLGRTMRLWKARSALSVLPDPQVLWMDANGEVWISELKIPMLGTLRSVRTEEALAKADVEPTEIFFASLVEPKGLIDEPRTLSRGVYRIAGRDLEAAFVDGPGQRVLERGEGWVRVEVQAPPAPDAPFEPPYEADPKHATYLKATALLETDDPLVRELAAKAPKGGNAVDLARWIEGFVRDHIDNKSFGVGFGTAAEVARAKEGDCTEHGVLCAALARVLGLPSRVVVGLAYLDTRRSNQIEADGVFGYHMWTEVLVAPDVWMPIDAALGAMDATHLAMARSDLASVSPLADLVLPILGAMGDLEIEILEPATVAAPQGGSAEGGG